MSKSSKVCQDKLWRLLKFEGFQLEVLVKARSLKILRPCGLSTVDGWKENEYPWGCYEVTRVGG